MPASVVYAFLCETLLEITTYIVVNGRRRRRILIQVHIEDAGYIEGKTVIPTLSISLQQASIIGLIGGNGAGKSTTIQAMLGTLPFAQVTHTLPNTFGYVPERPILYEYYTLREHIELLIHTIDEPNDTLLERAYMLCDTFKLRDKLDHYPIQFSKGMQQKVMLILAFTPMHTFYIVDEPFMGLDPQAIRALLLLLEERRHTGATILMSTHALDTAEKLCDSFLCMHEGVLIAQGTLHELQMDEDESLLTIFDRVIEEVSL